MSDRPRISKEILIEDLVEAHPEAVPILREFGIVCIQCGEPIWGSLEEAAREKGIENIDEVVKKLNDRLSL